jgi:hypothetical protein
MKHVALPLLAIGIAATTACMNEREYMDPTVGSSFGSNGETTGLNLQNGALRGDFGARRGFDGPADELQGSSDTAWPSSTVTLTRTEQERGTGMVILWTQGITIENLAVGTHDFRYDPNSVDTPPVSANVCSGRNASDIDYDRPADQVTVDVTQTPAGRQFDVHTETARVDPATGEATDEIEASDSTFVIADR